MRWPDLEAKQNLERERQTTKVWRLQVNQKTCFDHVTFLEIGEIEEKETSRDLEDEKGLRKALVVKQGMTHWPKRSRCGFLNLAKMLRVRPLKFE